MCVIIHNLLCMYMHWWSCARARLNQILDQNKMERLLTTAKELSSKVDSNELASRELLKECETLQHQLKVMRQVLCLSSTLLIPFFLNHIL